MKRPIGATALTGAVLAAMPLASAADPEYGPGVMGGMGAGRMGALWSLDLKDDQVEKIGKIREELWSRQRALMQQMWDQQEKLRTLYGADKPDRAAISKGFAKMGELQREMFEAHFDAEKKMEEVLTKEQREQLRRNYRRWGMMMGW